MRNEIQFPAQYASLTMTECVEVLGGETQASSTGLAAFMSNVSKVSKVFSYVARLFSVASSMLNNVNTFYTTFNTLTDYIQKNF